ncbi:MAG: hypothetical protein WBH56_04365 [Bacteroidota bacterium]
MRARQIFGPIPTGALLMGAAIISVSYLSGCSLLTLQSPAEPLSTKQVNARILTHDFAIRFANEVETAADSIFENAEEFPVKVDALRWKIGAYNAIRESALREVPGVAMVATWALCVQMEEFFLFGAGDSLFGEMQGAAIDASVSLETEIDSLVRSFASPAEYRKTSNFVRSFADQYPFEDMAFKQEPILRAWNQAEGLPDSAAVKTVGDLPQTVADLASRLNIQTANVPKQTLWQIQLLMAEAGLAGPEARAAMDSLQVDIRKFGDLAEASPELLDSTLKRLSRDLDAVLRSVDRQRKETLDILSSEREAISKVVQSERVAIMKDLDSFSQVTLEKTYAMLRDVVDSVLLYGIIFATFVLSIPFVIGYVVG